MIKCAYILILFVWIYHGSDMIKKKKKLTNRKQSSGLDIFFKKSHYFPLQVGVSKM